ncbi:MAG: histidine phosphatase family protein [Actinomycetota bacterium]
MQSLLMLRHGESEWNVAGRWQGWADVPLTARGEAEAGRRAAHLARDGVAPRAIYTSDLVRASRTAEIIAAHLEVPLVVHEGFRERHVGEWSGLTNDEIDAGWPGQREQWRRGEIPSPPGGETDAELLARFDAGLTDALAHVGTGHLLVVGHNGNVRAAARRAGGNVGATRVPNLSGFWFTIDGDGRLRDPVSVGTLPDEDLHGDIE